MQEFSEALTNYEKLQDFWCKSICPLQFKSLVFITIWDQLLPVSDEKIPYKILRLMETFLSLVLPIRSSNY